MEPARNAKFSVDLTKRQMKRLDAKIAAEADRRISANEQHSSVIEGASRRSNRGKKCERGGRARKTICESGNAGDYVSFIRIGVT